MLAQIRARREIEEIAENSANSKSIEICTIQPFEELKTFSTYNYPSGSRHVNGKTNGIG